jgi:hypothetical protein
MLLNTLIFRAIVKMKSVSVLYSSHSYCFHSHSMYFTDWDVNNTTDEEGEETCWGEEEKTDLILCCSWTQLNFNNAIQILYSVYCFIFFSHEIFDFSGKSLETLSLHLICWCFACVDEGEREIMWFLRWNEKWVVLTIVVCQVALTRS